MTLDDIVALSREWLDDEAEPFLYKQERLYFYASEAQDQFCLRSRCLIDSTTPSICEIPLVSGQASYKLHDSIVVARRIEYFPADTSCGSVVLRRTTFDQLDYEDAQWTSRTGQPDSVVQNLRARQLTLNAIPGDGDLGTLRLTVWRKPTASERLTVELDEPVISIDEQFHPALAHWVCYRALLKKDAEANDDSRAGAHLDQFTQVAGPAPTFQQIVSLASDEAGEVRPYFF